ncbi:MAG: hypothetical protein PWP08_797 [Methanofollis sp.]|nr:hypothetical protein [Methanofollis sp.]
MKRVEDVMVRVPVLTMDDPMTRARQMLRDDIFREIAVTDTKGRYVGYIDITDALRVTDTKSDVLIEGFVREGTAVPPGASLIAVSQAIREKNTDTAVVVNEENHVLGGVLLSEIFPILCTREELRGTVRDYMKAGPPICNADDHLGKIYSKMIECDISAFAVIKEKNLTGMLSRRDILKNGRVRKSLENGGKVPVESVMTTPVITIEKDESISAAAELMVSHDLSQLPVVDGDVLVGMIDRHGVLNGLHAKE